MYQRFINMSFCVTVVMLSWCVVVCVIPSLCTDLFSLALEEVVIYFLCVHGASPVRMGLYIIVIPLSLSLSLIAIYVYSQPYKIPSSHHPFFPFGPPKKKHRAMP